VLHKSLAIDVKNENNLIKQSQMEIN